MVRETVTQWSNAGVRLGFNINRTFSMGHKEGSK